MVCGRGVSVTGLPLARWTRCLTALLLQTSEHGMHFPDEAAEALAVKGESASVTIRRQNIDRREDLQPMYAATPNFSISVLNSGPLMLRHCTRPNTAASDGKPRSSSCAISFFMSSLLGELCGRKAVKR